MSALQAICVFFLLVGTVLTICCVALPYWKVNDPEDTIRDNAHRYEGLWLKCSAFGTGNWDCDDFNRFFLGLPSELQAGRGLSLSSVALAVLALIVMTLGMDSMPFASDNKTLKRRTRLISAVMGLIAALLIVAAVSWYANDVRIEHEFDSQRLLIDPTTNVNRNIFGVCLFLGWIGGVLLIIASAITICTNCTGERYEDAHPRYGYKPHVKPAGGQEYI